MSRPVCWRTTPTSGSTPSGEPSTRWRVGFRGRLRPNPRPKIPVRLRNCLKRMAGTTGLEPATSAVTGQRSNQLNYVPLQFLRARHRTSGQRPQLTPAQELRAGGEPTKYSRSSPSPQTACAGRRCLGDEINSTTCAKNEYPQAVHSPCLAPPRTAAKRRSAAVRALRKPPDNAQMCLRSRPAP